MNLHRLIYTSDRAEHCDDQEVEKILETCKRKNPSDDITGVLVHSKTKFFQYLEGDKDAIMTLYKRIEKDTRHHNCVLKNYEPIDGKIFSSWSMGYKDLDSQLVEFNTEEDAKTLLAFENLIYGNKSVNDEGIAALREQFLS